MFKQNEYEQFLLWGLSCYTKHNLHTGSELDLVHTENVLYLGN